MYLFYVDESGNLDCELTKVRADGSVLDKDWLYVLTAVSLFEHKWHGFEKTLNRKKRTLMARVIQRGGPRLDLADCEIKSNWLRNPKETANHPLLSHLYPAEIQELVELFYTQLTFQPMQVFSVVVDKRKLQSHMDQDKLHRKAWELLLERVEEFMRTEHNRHQGVMLKDDVSVQHNRSLAMKHAYFQEEGTTAGLWLTRIAEMPLFVRSELSNGIQLADLVSYNIYRALKTGDLTYPWFVRIAPRIWSVNSGFPRCRGLKIFPPESELSSQLPALDSLISGAGVP